MISFIARRLLQAIPVVFLGSLAIWAMIYAVPGGPVAILVGEDATAEQIAAAIAENGLDRSVLLQYLDWLGHAATGDFGESIHGRVPVLQLIGERLPATMHLAAAAMVISLLIGVPVAVASAVRPGTWIDRMLSGWNALALGVPTFWMGILLILFFSVYMRWLPSASAYVPIWEDPVACLTNLFLPALTLGIYISGVLARFLRASLVTELRADYVRTARSKGLPERLVVSTHVLRNALLPFITILGLMLANFMAGAVVTEAVFTYPGLGRLLIQAISTRDYPLIQGCILVILILYMLINLLVDVLYAYVDPRISYA
jgi:peptide/nickel transport system permease protein